MSTLTVSKSAVISTDEVYRYRLTRYWDHSLPPVVWVMLNPSTADALVDDPTIVRCCRYAQAWGYGGIIVVNLYAYRATEPAELLTAKDPVGPENDKHIGQVFWAAMQIGGLVVCGWGNNAQPDRVAKVHTMAVERHTQLHALRVTKSGQPGHPLYLPGNLTSVPWP